MLTSMHWRNNPMVFASYDTDIDTELLKSTTTVSLAALGDVGLYFLYTRSLMNQNATTKETLKLHYTVFL